jgi:hypothetical protein
MAKRPTLVTTQRPTRDSFIITLSHNGEYMEVPLRFDQVRLLAIEATEAACMWPAAPAKAS